MLHVCYIKYFDQTHADSFVLTFPDHGLSIKTIYMETRDELDLASFPVHQQNKNVYNTYLLYVIFFLSVFICM